MINRLHKRLTFIYSFTTSLIITIVIIFTFLFVKYQIEIHTKTILLDVLNEIEFKLQTEQKISQTWISTTSANYQISISIMDNGKPLLISDIAQAPISQKELPLLVDTVKKLAFDEGIDTSTYPISFKKEKSSVFLFRDKQNHPYYGCVSLLAKSSGWQTIIIIQSLSKQQTLLFKYGLLFAFVNLLTIFILYFFSKYFVGKTLKPVIDNQQKQKEFIASASHELRSPLAVIRATISSLKMDVNNLSEASINMEYNNRSNYLNDIDGEAIRMSALIDDLLLLSSSQANTWSLKKESFDIETFLINIYETYLLLAVSKEQNLTIELPEDTLPPIYADKQRLWQAISIILNNALYYTPNQKNIIITSHQKKHALFIKIIDHGVGISDDKKLLVFDNFYRVDSSRVDKNHFGLGLSIAKELITLHNGKIIIQDTPGG